MSKMIRCDKCMKLGYADDWGDKGAYISLLAEDELDGYSVFHLCRECYSSLFPRLVEEKEEQNEQPTEMPMKPGERFTWKGRTYVALGMEQGGLLAITEKPVFEKEPFDKHGSNDWRKSTLRYKLNGMFLEEIGKEDLLPFTSDLTSDDGLKDYGTAEDYVFLLSADLYRKYRPYIQKQETWWWLITPCTIDPRIPPYVRSIDTCGGTKGDDTSYTRSVVVGLLFNLESIRQGEDVLRQQHGA